MLHSPVFDWGKDFIEKFDLSSCAKILDIGCRQGQLSSYIAQRYTKQQFVAIDNMPDMLNQAKAAYQTPNLLFEESDALTLDYSENFDAIISFSCLHWIQNKTRVLQNIHRALKPGSKAFLQFFALHGRPRNDRFFDRIAQTTPWKPYFKNFSPDYFSVTLAELSQLLQNIGFIIHRMEFVRHQTIFEHPDVLHQWLRTWTSHTKSIPKQKCDVFLKEFLNEYLTFHHYSWHNPFPYYEYLLEIICEKPSTPPILINHNLHQYGSIIFTKHEVIILKHYLQGKSAKEIGLFTSVSAKTIEFHIAKIKEKLHCQRRSEIMQAALQHGFINLIFS